MSSAKSSIAGSGVMVGAVVILLAWVLWSAMHQTVRLDGDDAGAKPQAAATMPDMRVDLNSASVAELSMLPGLGPGLAQRIIDDREQRGPFKSIADLDRVSGIGPAIVERISPFAVAENRVDEK